MISSLDLIEMFSEIAVAMSENRERLCDLDREDGDGDHGVTMNYAFTALEGELTALDPAEVPPARLFDLGAETFLKIDESSTALYASAFRRAGSALFRYRRIGAHEFGEALSAMAAGFRDHGRSGEGRRNVRDVWEIAIAAYLETERNGGALEDCLEAALAAAASGRHLAEGGRLPGKGEPPDFTGLDAGGASALLIIRAMRDSLSQDA